MRYIFIVASCVLGSLFIPTQGYTQHVGYTTSLPDKPAVLRPSVSKPAILKSQTAKPSGLRHKVISKPVVEKSASPQASSRMRRLRTDDDNTIKALLGAGVKADDFLTPRERVWQKYQALSANIRENY